MLPPFDDAGNLPAGIYWPTWDEFAERFGTTQRRLDLIKGLREALLILQAAGCSLVYIDGSFVTIKEMPGDFDGCWDPAGVDVEKVAPVLLEFSKSRKAQKDRFGGELLTTEHLGIAGRTILEFFQEDRAGNAKGIVAFRLQEVAL